ncbi:UbiX family flavin prenyltransferase [Anaplasma capra]|uniref:UbiX family flavin prenyltransferase n=1 Tax=Anaplasma capra TaxID=1562740 RepID=UPI0021D5FCD8|nr:UbiX family flavin prenyltransferase [Anaplasma capra]MCU7611626.1 UbiX family flavin prenyltransferase [Anaplasma capra]MCU7612226.1 UbiX family flavin prenyltransferase [Anaplasma capra]
MQKRIIVGISGASGALYAVRMLQKLRQTGYEVHLVVSDAAKVTIAHECGHLITVEQLCSEYCTYYHDAHNVGASIASGSFKTTGMVVVPCSVRTMSEIASGITSSLLTRAADVILKERKRLVLMPRETPLHLGHLRTMVSLAEMGAIIAPPIPAFYHHPKSLDDIVSNSVDRVLDILGVQVSSQEWQGI